MAAFADSDVKDERERIVENGKRDLQRWGTFSGVTVQVNVRPTRAGYTGARAIPSVQLPLPSSLIKFWLVYAMEVERRMRAMKAQTIDMTRKTALRCHFGSSSQAWRRVSTGTILAVVK